MAYVSIPRNHTFIKKTMILPKNTPDAVYFNYWYFSASLLYQDKLATSNIIVNSSRTAHKIFY